MAPSSWGCIKGNRMELYQEICETERERERRVKCLCELVEMEEP